MYVSPRFFRLMLAVCLGVLFLSACGGSKEVAVREDPRSAMDKQMDTQALELTENLTDADVVRTPNGISVTFYQAVLFAFDSAELSEAALKNLQFFAESMNRYTGTSVLVIGHTDAVGATDYNQALSERRAESVASFIKQQNVASERVQMMGMGESDPIASNDTEEGRRRNRRVVLIIAAST